MIASRTAGGRLGRLLHPWLPLSAQARSQRRVRDGSGSTFDQGVRMSELHVAPIPQPASTAPAAIDDDAPVLRTAEFAALIGRTQEIACKLRRRRVIVPARVPIRG